MAIAKLESGLKLPSQNIAGTPRRWLRDFVFTSYLAKVNEDETNVVLALP